MFIETTKVIGPKLNAAKMDSQVKPALDGTCLNIQRRHVTITCPQPKNPR